MRPSWEEVREGSLAPGGSGNGKILAKMLSNFIGRRQIWGKKCQEKQMPVINKNLNLIFPYDLCRNNH